MIGDQSREVLLGIDVGTTVCKAVLVTPDGREVAAEHTATPWRRHGTTVEADPAALKAAAQRAVAGALRSASAPRVVAVGVTGMAETGVLLDAGGACVTPSIAWHDPRGGEEAGRIRETFGDRDFADITGLPISALCTLAKYLWLRRNDTSAARGRRWFSVAEWLVREFGGEEVAELSLASRTGFLDVRSGTWSRRILDWAGIPAGFLPTPCPAGTPAGQVTDGLPGTEGAVLTVAGHDHVCAVIGAGALAEGDVVDSCGTAEALIGSRTTPPEPGELAQAVVDHGLTIGRHVLTGRFSVIGAFASGLALRRFLALLGIDPEDRVPLDDAAAAAQPGAGDIRVEDITAERATVTGIGQDAAPALLWRAALEAVAREGRDRLADVERFAGPCQRLVVTGGWAHNHALNAVKEDILGPFVRPDVGEASARGAALLAGHAAGLYPTLADLPRPPLAGAPARPATTRRSR